MRKTNFAISAIAALLFCGGISSATADDNHAGAAEATEEAGVYMSPDEASWGSCGLDEFPVCEASLLQGDPSKGAYAMYVRLPAGGGFIPHWHSNAHYLVGVKGTLTFTWKNGSTSELAPGTFLYWPGGERMEGQCGDDSMCVYYDQQTDFGDVHFYDE